MSSPSTDVVYYVGQGNLNLAPRITAGAINGGFRNVGDLQAVQLSLDQKFADVFENNTGYGFQALHAPVEIAGKIKLVMSQWSTPNLQAALWGTAPTANPGGTVTAESTTAYNGGKTYLAHIGVTSLVLTTSGGSPSTLVEGTDYTVDGSYGSYTILPGSTIVPAGPGVALKAAYTYAATNGSVGAFTAAPTEWSVRVDAKNVANPFVDSNGSAFEAVSINVYRAFFDATKMLDLIGKKDAPLELDGVLLIDPTVTFTPGNPRSVFFNIEKA